MPSRPKYATTSRRSRIMKLEEQRAELVVAVEMTDAGAFERVVVMVPWSGGVPWILREAA
jgi:hypothetical protein